MLKIHCLVLFVRLDYSVHFFLLKIHFYIEKFRSWVTDCNRVEEIVRAYITKALSVSKIITSSTLEVINLPGISFTPGETYDPDNIHIISILDQDGKVVSR